MNSSYRTAILVCLLAVSAVPSAALVTRDPAGADPRVLEPARVDPLLEPLDAADPSAAGSAVRAFLAERGGQWQVTVDRRTGRPGLVQGSGIPMIPGAGNTLDARALEGLPLPAGEVSLDTLEPLARAFIERHPALLRPLRGALRLDRDTSTIRQNGRLASLYFTWQVDGVPVEGALVYLRLNSGNLTQFGTALIGPVTADTEPSLTPDTALALLMDYTGDDELYRLQSQPELWLQPEARGPAIDYRLIWKITYRIKEHIATWEGRVDAHTGEIVGFRDTNAYARVVGGVYPRTVFDQDETRVPFPHVNVFTAMTAQTGDTSGAYSYSGGTASSSFSGQYFSSNCVGCSNPTFAQVQVGLGTGRLDFGLGGTDQVGNGLSTAADRNTIYHLNQIRRIAKKWLPSLPWLDGTLSSFVNINDQCNAVYNGSVNFYRSGGGCNNTGEIADVVYHEWGHGIDGNTRLGDGATGEGTGDVAAMHVSHSPLIGPGFFSSGGPVRNIDPAGPRGLLTTSNIGLKCPVIGSLGPLGYEVHCEGEIYGQAAWDLSQALVAKHGQHTGWRASERIFFASLPDAQSYLPNGFLPVYNAYLNADDDDGNLSNGTPNADEIFSTFNQHGIASIQVSSSAQCARPVQPALSVTPQCDSFDLSWDTVPGAAHYEVFRGELREDQALFSLGTVPPGQTDFTDLEVAPSLDYWYVVMAVDATGCESTIENLVPARLPDQPILSVSAAAANDTPRGNRSGFPDPGEEVDLVLGLANVGDVPAAAVSGTVTSATPGVNLLEGQSSWAPLAPGAVGNNGDVLRFQTDEASVACGDTIQFQFVPDESTGCAAQTSFFEIELGDQGICDPTPACFVAPSFAGLAAATPGASCAETELNWQAATSNCTNATVSYNVYRSTDPAFVPEPAHLVAQGVSGTSFVDTLLVPGQVYHYAVRAFDSRSGEDSNSVKLSTTAPTTPDIRAPVFAGLTSATDGAECGTTELGWSAGLEACSGPISYLVYRSTDPAFVPGPATLIGSTTSLSFVDAALTPAASFTYVVRAADGAGNVDANGQRLTTAAGVTDRLIELTDFESGADGWAVTTPNDATTGNWEWGDPLATGEQPGDCAGGFSCWITGLLATLPGGGNNDVDGGSTTLLSKRYDITETVDPVVRYARWYTNDQGSNPGEDPLVVEVTSNNGLTWDLLEQVNGTPLAWLQAEAAIPASVPRTSQTRFRFIASDLGGGSLVEAGIDDFTIVDRDQGCTVCALPVAPVGTIFVDRDGDDVVLDWSADPASGARFVVYLLTGPDLGQVVRVGSTNARTFVHEGAALLQDDLYYRVTALDSCGNESSLD